MQTTPTSAQGGPLGPGADAGLDALAGPELDPEVERQITRWWPQRLERTQPDPPAIAFCRRAVRAWGPPDKAQSGQALATAYRYVCWRVDQALDLDLEYAFNEADITAYLEGPLANSPKNTRKSASHYLHRLHPDWAPDPERRVAQSLAALNLARAAQGLPPSGYLIPGEEVTGDIADVIATYVPKSIDPSRFERVAHLVRSAVKAWGPKTPTRAVNALGWCSYVAAWVDAQDRPLRIDVVFHPDTIEDYVAMRLAGDANAKSIATEASALRSISKALLPTLRASKRVQIARTMPDTPDSTDEINLLVASCATPTSRTGQRYALPRSLPWASQ